MSDIIKDAKQLLDGATPGPWELINGEIHQIQHTPDQCTSIRCDHRWPVLSESWGESAAVVAADEDLALMAAVPELAQALAEESYEYAVEEKWLTNDGPVWRAVGNRWHLSMSAAQSDAVQYCQTRIVRRRVSPVEVVNDNRFTR